MDLPDDHVPAGRHSASPLDLARLGRRLQAHNSALVGTLYDGSNDARLQPWQDMLEKLTGRREMDISALIESFQPLMDYLKQRNEGLACGWQGEAGKT
ncbi:MAG: M2 family metallopeptidase [Solimonas sp.]